MAFSLGKQQICQCVTLAAHHQGPTATNEQAFLVVFYGKSQGNAHGVRRGEVVSEDWQRDLVWVGIRG